MAQLKTAGGGAPQAEDAQAKEFGAALRQTRLAAGRDIAEIARQLRIRQSFLQAIEDGRFDDLPGPTYAIGFVRAYADYLGLDQEEVVKRYKELRGGINTVTTLLPPAPVTEGRLPTGTVLLVAVVLAAAAYGGWYYLSAKGRNPGELVTTLPDRIARMVGLQPEAPAAAPAPPAPEPTPETAAPATAPSPPASSMEAPAASSAAAPAPSSALPSPAAPAAPREAAPETPSPGAAATPSAPAQPAAPPAPAAAPVPAPAASPAAPPAAGPAMPPASGPAPPPAPEPSAPVASSPPVPPAAAGAPPPAPAGEAPAGQVAAAPAAVPGSRVTLRANSSSWVEIRNKEDRRVFSRLMRAGETYAVPPTPGLSLTTGNAGGLTVEVDGKTLPPLGNVGDVRRDLALDADALLKSASPTP